MGINNHFKREALISLLWLPVIGIIGFLMAVIAPYFLESTSPSSESYSEMEASGLMQIDWIPQYLPKSAYDIYVSQNTDTNEVQLKFNYTVRDSRSLVQACGKTNSDQFKSEYRCHNGTQPITVTLFFSGKGELKGRRN